MFYYDPTYIFVLIGAIIALMVQSSLKKTYSKYAQVYSKSSMTGAMVAEKILSSHGIYDVEIVEIAGELTDNYNPTKKVLSLSRAVYNGTSIAAAGIAAHECGHVIQHDNGYLPLKLRNAIVPVVQIGSNLSWPCILLGLLFSAGETNFLMQLGIFLFSFAVIFQLITVPVEYDASSKALRILESNGILYEEECRDASKVLNAAALTYVAALANSIIQLLRLVYLFGGRRRD